MSDVERSIWLEVVNDKPAAAFTPAHSPLLGMYVRHVARELVLAEQITRFQPEWLHEDGGLERYDQLLRLAERESRAASSLATRLRITPQSIDRRAAARLIADEPIYPRPWKTDDD